MTQTPSSGGGATPDTGTPATGTAPGGATPPKLIATTLEEALARIAELEKHANNKSEEAARHGKNLTAAEKELAAYKEKERLAHEATLSEIDKAQKRATDLEAQIQQYKQELINAQVRLAAKDKGIIDPDMAALALHDKLEYDDSGMPSNLDKALDDLIKNKPYLVPKAEEPAPASAAQTANRTPVIPGMNPPRSGRSDIPSPAGTSVPGRIPRLTDPGMWKT
jgi:hypothetical protein